MKAERDMLYIREPEMPSNPKLLKVSLLGAPNAGKSSLLNRLMNRRVNIYENLDFILFILIRIVKFDCKWF